MRPLSFIFYLLPVPEMGVTQKSAMSQLLTERAYMYSRVALEDAEVVGRGAMWGLRQRCPVRAPNIVELLS